MSLKDCRILLGSGGFSGSDKTMVYLREQIDTFLGKTTRVLVIPYAQKDPLKPLSGIEKYHLVGSRDAQSITNYADPKEAVKEAEAFIVWGGNTFRLLKNLYDKDLVELIRERVQEGVPYIGISAGTNVATPTIKTTNDMPIVQPKSMDALKLVPFQINPHYFEGSIYFQSNGVFERYAGETRDDRIKEFHEENDTPVIGIPEATFLHAENGKILFMSLDPKTARVFKKGQTPMDFPSATDISEHLR